MGVVNPSYAIKKKQAKQKLKLKWTLGKYKFSKIILKTIPDIYRISSTFSLLGFTLQIIYPIFFIYLFICLFNEFLMNLFFLFFFFSFFLSLLENNFFLLFLTRCEKSTIVLSFKWCCFFSLRIFSWFHKF